MSAILRHGSSTIIKSFFFLMVVTTAFSALIMETTIELSEDAVSPQMQPLQLIYYPSRSVERFTLALPDINGDAVTVTADEGSELWLMCSPENPNGFKNMEAKITGTAIVRNEPPAAGWQLSHTKCKNKVTASIHNTRTQCAQNTGTIYEVGFLVYIGTVDEEIGKPKKKTHLPKISLPGLRGSSSKKKVERPKPTEFISLYESCFDDRQKIVKLVKRTTRGSKFKAKARLDSIPVLPEEEWTYDNPNLEEMYKKDTQFETFFDILNKYDDVTIFNDRAIRFLVELQLIPAGNMIFYSWRAVVFTQFNITAAWESVKGIGWRKVEETVDTYLSKTPHDIDIVAGTYEILSLGKKNLDIYLQPNSHPPTTGVPRIIWKLLYNTFTNDAVVFIAINNPHATKCELDLCPDRCLHNSPLADFKDPWTGCIICCSYKDARERIRDIPHYDHVALVILVQE